MIVRVFPHAFHALLHSTHPSIAWFSGDEEEVGGAIHPPNLGTKHTTMLVVNHSCSLASFLGVFGRFGSLAWLERSSVCWTPRLVHPTLDAQAGASNVGHGSSQRPTPSHAMFSFAFVLMSSMLCYCFFFVSLCCMPPLHIF